MIRNTLCKETRSHYIVNSSTRSLLDTFLQPLFCLPIKLIMHLQIPRPFMTTMPWHIHQHLNPHSLLLEICQVPIPRRIRPRLLFVNFRKPTWIKRQDLVLLVPVANEPRSPYVFHLLEEETEAAVDLDIEFNIVVDEALCDSCFELGDCALAGWVYVCGAAVAAVHDECVFVHTGF